MRRIEDQSFLLLLLVVSIAFGWILQPFYGAILWATVAAVIFAPLNRKLLVRTGGRPGIAASVTVLIIIAMVILPLAMIAASLTQEASSLYAKVQSGEYDFARYIQRIFDALPAWATGLLDRFNLNNLPAVRDWLASGAMKGGQVLAPQALSIGMNTFDFMIGLGIMLYLLFFCCVTAKRWLNGSSGSFHFAPIKRRHCSADLPTSSARRLKAASWLPSPRARLAGWRSGFWGFTRRFCGRC